jgi:hypothetical protein
MGQLTRLDSCCQAWACQHEVKGLWTVALQYRPSGRAKDQEAGAVGEAGAWSVRPAAPAAAPGKMYIAIIVLFVYDIICIHCMHISPVSGDMRLRHRIIPTTSYNTDVTHAYRIRYRRKRHRRKPTISYTTSYVTWYVRLARTVQKTYDVNIVGQNL